MIYGWLRVVNSALDGMRTVNEHEANTHFSRQIDAAHAAETTLVTKSGKTWARLVLLEKPRPRRQPGLLRGRLRLLLEELMKPLPEEELEAIEISRVP